MVLQCKKFSASPLYLLDFDQEHAQSMLDAAPLAQLPANRLHSLNGCTASAMDQDDYENSDNSPQEHPAATRPHHRFRFCLFDATLRALSSQLCTESLRRCSI